MLDTSPLTPDLSLQQTSHKKKLIEVALPLQAINAASLREKNGNSHIHGHPSTLHFWWAPRPLVACRALLFALLVDDPSAHPELFPTPDLQTRERTRLFKLIERLVVWENSLDLNLLAEASAEIERSLGKDLPTVYDPFCGRGAIPIEGQRLGLSVEASDLNPVAVMIAKALLEIPWTFRGQPPVHPTLRGPLSERTWERATGLAADVAAYGKWMFDQARATLGPWFPTVKLEGGRDATVIAWLWTHTVHCSNPVCGADAPLVKSFALSTKRNREWSVEPAIDLPTKTVSFNVIRGTTSREGTIGRRGAKCLVCDSLIPLDHIRAEGKAKRLGARLLAIIAEGPKGRVYLSPDLKHEDIALRARPEWSPDTSLPDQALGFRVQAYGMTRHRDLFTQRQLLTLTTLSDLVRKTRAKVLTDATSAGLAEGTPLEIGGSGARAYADAVATYLAMAVDRQASYSSNLCTWNSPGETMFQVFTRQILQVKWDFAEANPLSDSTGNFGGAITWVEKALAMTSARTAATVRQRDAADGTIVARGVFATDPPYYDNVPYADLSDFFYVWLRASLGDVYPDLLSTVLAPKAQELIADPARFNGDRDRARKQFEDGLEQAFLAMYKSMRDDIPAMIIYAFKQSERNRRGDDEDDHDDAEVQVSIGWEAMLSAMLKAGFQITGTWPLTTERQGRLRSVASNALASSIVLTCRRRTGPSLACTRVDFLRELRSELPIAVKGLRDASLAATDLEQAAIGPGMAVFSQYERVLEANGTAMSIRSALALINQQLTQIILGEIADVDPESRFAIAWFDEHFYDEAKFGEAEVLLKAKNANLNILRESGVVRADRGIVQLLPSSRFNSELYENRDGSLRGLPAWSQLMYLIAALTSETGGLELAAETLRALDTEGAERLKDVAYHCYLACNRAKRSAEAQDFNALVTAWPDLQKLVQERAAGPSEQRLL